MSNRVDEDRRTLLSMGFTLDRIDWALRETSPTSDLQARLDHILEHEREPSPSISFPIPSTALSSTSSVPKPSTISNVPYTPPSAAWSSASVAGSNPSVTPVAHSPVPSNVNRPLNSATISDPRTALQRFEAILAEEQSMHESIYEGRKEIGTKVYKMLKDFFDEELSRRKAEYGLSGADIGEIPVAGGSHQSNNPFAPRTDSEEAPPLPPRKPIQSAAATPTAADALVAPTSSIVPPNTSTPSPPSSSRPQSTWTRDPLIYDSCAVYYPNRTLLPPSTDLASALSSVTDHFESSSTIQESLSNVNKLRSQMEDTVSNLRLSHATSSTGSIFAPGGADQQKRAEEHSQKISHLYSTNQWEAASRLEKEYQDHEKQLIQENKEREFEEWKKQFWSPARDQLFTTLQKVFAEYTIVEGVLKKEVGSAPGQVPRIKLNVLEAVRALNQVADLRDRAGYEGLDGLEDEIKQREHDLKVQAAFDNFEKEGGWGTSEILDKKKALQDAETKLKRARSKLQRRTPFYELTINALSTVLHQVDMDKALLLKCATSILSTIPDAPTFEQEATETKAGSESAIRVALPSKELINQLYSATAKIATLDGIAEEIRSEMRNLREKETGEVRAQVMAELTFEETKAGRGGQVWLGPGKALQDRADKEDQQAQAEWHDEVQQRRERSREATEPTYAALQKYKEREVSVLGRLMQGVDVHGQAIGAGSVPPSGSAPGSSDAYLDAAHKMMMDQQKTQMISNMMWNMHASRMGVINNIGSSNTQWVVSRW